MHDSDRGVIALYDQLNLCARDQNAVCVVKHGVDGVGSTAVTAADFITKRRSGLVGFPIFRNRVLF